jgi:hypothetical protein
MQTIVLSEKNEDIRGQQRRLYCLALAAQTYQMAGRMDGVITLAGEYETWVLQAAGVTRAAPPQLQPLLALAQQPAPEEPGAGGAGDDDAGPIAPGANGGRDTSHDMGGVQDAGGGMPPSLRQTKDKPGTGSK